MLGPIEIKITVKKWSTEEALGEIATLEQVHAAATEPPRDMKLDEIAQIETEIAELKRCVEIEKNKIAKLELLNC
ncbi:MAG: hypothetical protein WB697_02615 [Stellaceae bacterium]